VREIPDERVKEPPSLLHHLANKSLGGMRHRDRWHMSHYPPSRAPILATLEQLAGTQLFDHEKSPRTPTRYEIVMQTDSALNVWRGDGTTFPGWPKTWSGRWIGNSAPVIGDVDGDTLPDIAITTQPGGSSLYGDVRLYNRDGVLHPHFLKWLIIGAGGVPAIADIDLDGRNEPVVLGSAWDGYEGLYDKVWAYDLDGSNYTTSSTSSTTASTSTSTSTTSTAASWCAVSFRECSDYALRLRTRRFGSGTARSGGCAALIPGKSAA
jgi:hypothetical protein